MNTTDYEVWYLNLEDTPPVPVLMGTYTTLEEAQFRKDWHIKKALGEEWYNEDSYAVRMNPYPQTPTAIMTIVAKRKEYA